MPERIQRKRTKGWKMPPNTVYVGRPTKWGNPYSHKQLSPYKDAPIGRRRAVVLFFGWLLKGENGPPMNRENLLNNLIELRGKNLACWCPLDQPCHADILLKLANE